MQALDQGLISECGNPAFARPGRDALQRISAAAPRNRQAQQVGAGPEPTSALERFCLTRQGFDVQAWRQSRQKSREMINGLGGCFGHLSEESCLREPLLALFSFHALSAFQELS